MDIEVQGEIVRRVIMKNTMHGKEKLAVPSLMECTTLYSISHPWKGVEDQRQRGVLGCCEKKMRELSYQMRDIYSPYFEAVSPNPEFSAVGWWVEYFFQDGSTCLKTEVAKKTSLAPAEEAKVLVNHEMR